MIRVLTTRPADLDLVQLRHEARSVGAIDVGTYGDTELAGYWPDGATPDEAAFAALVAAHTPPPPPQSTDDRVAELEAILAALLEAP